MIFVTPSLLYPLALAVASAALRQSPPLMRVQGGGQRGGRGGSFCPAAVNQRISAVDCQRGHADQANDREYDQDDRLSAFAFFVLGVWGVRWFMGMQVGE